MAKYVYPAVFTPAEEGGFTVNFPDIPSCYTEGDSMAEALEMANDVLCLRLYDLEESGEAIPLPSAFADVAVRDDEVVSFVACDTLEYRAFYDQKDVKMTVSIPHWLDVIAKRSDVDYSRVFRDALIDKLHLR